MSRRKKWLLSGLVLLVAGLGTPALWFRIRSQRPNVLLITLDTTRADRLGSYGYKLAKTPCLDQLAAEGIVFDHALTHVPLTLPSHATMLTGLLPPEHGLHVNAMGRLSPDFATLPERFSSSNYRKGAFLAAFVLDHQFGLERGFDHYDDYFAGDQAISEAPFERRRHGRAVIDKALAWLSEGASRWSWTRKPYFCWIHLYDPHYPFAHTQAADKEFAGRPYDAEITYVDDQLQHLLTKLREQGEIDNTLIVVAGDHGEGLNEHAEETHGQQLYQSTLRVPLIFHWPGRFSGSGFSGPRRVPETVSLVDLSPTVLDLLGMPPLERTSGRSLLPALQGKPLELVRHFAETFEPYYELHSSPQRALVEEGWKYVQSKIPELYNLTDDPHELKNLVAIEKARADSMADLLREMEAKMIKGQPVETVIDERTMKLLKSIGYTGGKKPPEEDMFQRLPDIKELLPAFNRTTEALRLRSAGNIGDAERLLATIIKDQPQLLAARLFYAETLAQQASAISDNSEARAAKFEQAIEVCQGLIHREQEILRIPPDEQTWEAHLIFGAALSELGRETEAENACAAVEKMQPKNSKVQMQLGMTRIQSEKRKAQGIRNLIAATDIDKQLWQVHLVLAGIYQKQGNSTEALNRSRLAIEFNPQLAQAHMLAAAILMQAEKWSEAQQQLERSVAILPKDPILQQMLAECRLHTKQK